MRGQFLFKGSAFPLVPSPTKHSGDCVERTHAKWIRRFLLCTHISTDSSRAVFSRVAQSATGIRNPAWLRSNPRAPLFPCGRPRITERNAEHNRCSSVVEGSCSVGQYILQAEKRFVVKSAAIRQHIGRHNLTMALFE